MLGFNQAMSKHFRRRDFLKAIPALTAVASLRAAGRAKITDVRLVRLKLLKEVGSYQD